ncbi:MAG: hypothetical protein E2O52_10200 [Gammaproteobacteria bacterium]|nr:MAG: hypothetical protein E2O52_10200 [Gammaproteobacteria bacterium]
MQLPAPVQYVPYQCVGDQPNIIVDGAPLASTVLNLSHWPVNRTPAAVRRDSSTATVFAYLDMAELHQNVPIVSNNHFDEDGLCSMFALCQPSVALDHRALLIGCGMAGDFGVYEDADALRLCFILEAFGDPGVSPLPAETFAGCEQQRVESLYRTMLERLPLLLGDVNAYEALWGAQFEHVEESAELIARGAITIAEYADVDLAVVSIPDDQPLRTVRRYFEPEQAAVHPFAIHNATTCNRILRVTGARYELQYRYESWLQLVSHRPALRVALDGLAARLNAIEGASGTWRCESVTEIVPRLYLEGVEASSIELGRFVDEVCSYLATAPVAWDPYHWEGG